MSIIFFDGFDFYTAAGFGPGGRKWDQGDSDGLMTSGRFTGQAVQPNYAITKTLPVASSEIIVGMAMNFLTFTGVSMSPPQTAFLTFWDHNNPQCSVWIDPTTTTITVRTGAGTALGDITLGDSGFVPPLTLWFYLEIKMTIGNPGGFEIVVDGTTIATITGVQTQQTGSATTNKISVSQIAAFGNGVIVDDLYVINTQDATNNVTYLGEVRVQTMYPDAEGYRDDFLPSTGVNYQNVQVAQTDYTDHGLFNYSGTVGAIDAYSVGNFTITGTIFAVQENISFRKDDVGNRTIEPLMRTASTNYVGAQYPCFSSYTYAGVMFEINPNTVLPWNLTDLNNAQFGIEVYS